MSVLALPFPTIDPVLLELGPISVRWYGLAYFAGILIGWRYVRALTLNTRLWGGQVSPIAARDIDDFLIWATIGIVVGGRLGYVLFYNPAVFAGDPMAVFRVWEGGMAFHGGMLGTILAMILFSLTRKLPILSMLDVVAAGVPFGLFFGRIANFINGELYGRVTDVPWAMVFPHGGPLPRHPSQLYEAALEGVALFIALRITTHVMTGLRFPGLTGGVFVAGYGIARITAEFFRQWDPQIGLIGEYLTMGMILSVPMVGVGLGAIIIALNRGPRP